MTIKWFLVTLVTCLGLIQIHESEAMLTRMPHITLRITRYSYVTTRQSEIPHTQQSSQDAVFEDPFGKETDISETILKEAENDPTISLMHYFKEKIWPSSTPAIPEKKSEKEEPSKDEKDQKPSFFSQLSRVFYTPPLTLKNELIAGKQATIDEKSTLMQLYVANQFTYNGGSFASCGYHALKNSLFLVRALHGIHDDATLQETLNNFSRIKTLFGPLEKDAVGTWRAIIMQLRAERAFKNYIYHTIGLKKLDTVIDQTTIEISGLVYTFKKSKIHERLSTILDTFALQAARALTHGEVDHLIIESENIIEYIRNAVTQEGFIKSPEDFFETEPIENFEGKPDYICNEPDFIRTLILDHLSRKETIEKYVAVSAMKSFTLDLNASHALFKYYNDNNQNPLNSDGDWLQVEEIAMLHTFEQAQAPKLHKENREGLVCNLNYRFTIIEDIDDLTNTHGGDIDPAIYREIMRDMEDPLKEARDALNNEALPNYYHLFIISTAGRAGGSRGHWFALLLYKHEGRHDYIVMDSANNTSRLTDERVTKIISLLENQEIQISVSEEELTKLAHELRSAIKNNDAAKAFELHEQYKELGGKEDFSKELQNITF